MLTVISPAKKLTEKPVAGLALTDPLFAADAVALARVARGLSVADLRHLMDISDPLARLNHARFASFAAKPGPDVTYPAIHCFAGDTYTGLEARTMSPDALHWATGHLRILSGLYGLLRPFDAIQAYRLEMGSRLATPRGADLYAWWGDRIAKALVAQAAEVGTDTLINCASVEYFTAANRKALTLRVITPVFLDGPDGSARIVSFHAKTARGAMARHVCDHHLTDPADLRGFQTGGYAYRADLSDGDRMVFHRAQVAAA
ncbi:MAG: peroxide stress protein YaaA [Pseudomonadota bacterium]